VKIFLIRFAVIVTAIGLFAGCASQSAKEQEPAPVVDGNPVGAAVVAGPAAKTTPVITVAPKATPVKPEVISANQLKDPGSILSKRSIFYDYDSNVVKEEYKPLITAHARFLTQNRGRKVAIQGNTDERGSREYNIALGQRRADGVKQMMILLGVQEAQIEAVSFGEEKSRSSGKDDAAMAENRRSDIAYDGE